jgi:phosphoglycerate kinase
MRTPNDFNFSGKKALVRVDFNVPLDDNRKVTDDTRIRAALPTIKKILKDGGSAILMSHLGRPKGTVNEKYSLLPVAEHLSGLLKMEIKFSADCIGKEAETKAKNLKRGEILLIENLRFYKEEEAGDENFSRQLASLGDVYVNDAFGTAHRAHASTTIVANFFPENKLFGFLMADEVKSINKVLNSAERPLTAIIGGAKVSSKIDIIKQLIGKIDNLIIGGGMAYTFIKAKGGKIGSSLVEDDYLETALDIMREAEQKNVKIYLPTDTIWADSFSNDAEKGNSPIDNIPDGKMGLDIGPETEKILEKVIASSKTILWNGPMGVFEFDNFAHGTKTIADAIVKATSNGTYSLVGGGDSVAAVNKYGLAEQVSYVSTGGGAMLEYLEGKTLPGVAALMSVES